MHYKFNDVYCYILVVPEDLRLEAIQAALMLMPDENREVLQALLEFLYEVCQHSGVNQVSIFVYFCLHKQNNHC